MWQPQGAFTCDPPPNIHLQHHEAPFTQNTSNGVPQDSGLLVHRVMWWELDWEGVFPYQLPEKSLVRWLRMGGIITKAWRCYSQNKVRAKQQEESGGMWRTDWRCRDRKRSWRPLWAAGKSTEGALTQAAPPELPELTSPLATFVL